MFYIINLNLQTKIMIYIKIITSKAFAPVVYLMKCISNRVFALPTVIAMLIYIMMLELRRKIKLTVLNVSIFFVRSLTEAGYQRDI